jgi:RNA polymerase sigma-54 factor
MTELEKIEYTKAFIDKLANGINPLDDTPIPEGDIANNVRLSRCFFYVSDILRQVIENGGVTPPQKAPKAGKQAFTLTEEVRAGLQVSEAPLTVSELVSYLNDTVKEENVKRLATTAITGWMVEQGFMEVVELPSGKTAKRPTPTGNEIGLFTEERMGMYGAYTVVKFSPAAQTFVFDHMALIMEHYEGVKAAKKEQKAAATFLKQKIDSAKGFISAVQQRENTMLATMRAIVAKQKEYFINGGDEAYLKPMILEDIAKMTGFDISTISRVSNSKYVQTPWNVSPLKYFFSDGVVKDDGTEQSVYELFAVIKELVDAEDKNCPLTDLVLQEKLAERGYSVARRTVAKYREQLHIPVARLRKS